MLKKIIKDRKIIFKSILILAIVNIGNLSSLIIQIISSKFLTIDQFSFFYSSIAFIVLCSSPIISQNILIQENISNFKSNDSYKKYYINKLFKNIIYILFIYLFFFLIFFEKIELFLNHENNINFIKLFLIFIFIILNVVPSSYLVSEKKYFIPSTVFTLLDIIKLLIILYFFLFINIANVTIMINIQLIFVISIFLINFILLQNT